MISNVSMALSLADSIDEHDMPEETVISAQRGRFVVPADGVELRKGETCCGLPIYVHLQVHFCSKTQCFNDAIVMNAVVKCSACYRKYFIPMSNEYVCPVCSNT